MKADELAALSARPESEVEWEDLLLRLELMPRALRVEVENAGEACPLEIIGELVEREDFVHRRLEHAAGGGGTDRADPPDMTQMASSLADGVDRFVRLRNRNFAMLQRRGINVWDWMVEVGPTSPVSVFQLMSHLARKDVETLARLRQLRSPARPAC